MLARMRGFFGVALTEDIRGISGTRAAKLYEQAVEQPTRKTGEPPSAATHRFDLWAVRSLFAWAKDNGYVAANPFSGVKPVGKVRTGKPQLRIGEARRFTSEALRRYEEKGSPLALGALVALNMGLRTSEVLLRVVRDLDEGAEFLWVDGGKTDNARRHLEVPTFLRPYLLRQAASRLPESPLFPSPATGRFYPPQAMHRVVQEICVGAQVPRISTHSLRGLWATLAIGAGASSHAVAAALGHHSFAVTQRHYAQPSAVSNARTARVSPLLGGEATGRRADGLAALLVQLPAGLRVQVAAHLHGGAADRTGEESLSNRSVGPLQEEYPTEK
jgi:integrase